ncbi:hypothetical protein Bhyg_04851 [Pseudolycoriella hygida]|uniref:C-type lectin domain-containing protein n=1 Tax=Pseudolycoriella hygida TaxID=35572 RepID=A0A9Q0S9X1_9DIPT|nr:hypothetical protein Bhyg_04851 [Pseudolycoriella hygida]
MTKWIVLFEVLLGAALVASALTTFGKTVRHYESTTRGFDDLLTNPSYTSTSTTPRSTLFEGPQEVVKKVYHLHTTFTANWFRAYHHCIQNNMRLATATTDQELRQLRQQVSRSGFPEHFWTALTKLGNKHFYWFGSNTPVLFNSYVETEYCNDHGACAAVSCSSEKFLYLPCDELGYFVCEQS